MKSLEESFIANGRVINSKRESSILKYLYMGTLVSVIATSLISAQEYNMDLMEDIFNLDFHSLKETKVESASKLAQTIPETPANITLITKEQIEKRGYRNLLDLLDDLPSFNVLHFANAGLYSSVGIRGLMGQNYFKILRDGIEVDMTQSELVSIGMNYPLVGVKRVEILTGGASVIYGADAVSGVINLITDLEFGTSSTLSAGTGGYLYGDIRQATKLNDMTFTISAHSHRDEDYDFDKLYPENFPKSDVISSNGTVIESGQNRIFDYLPVHTQSLSFLLKGDKWDFGGSYSKTEDSTYISLTDYATTVELSQKESNMINEMRGAYFRYYHNFDTSVKLSSTISYDATELLPESYYINRYSDYNKAYKYFISERFALDEVLSVQHKNHSIIIGASAEHFYSMPKSYDMDHPYVNREATYPNSDVPIMYYDITWTNFGIFAQDQIKISDRFQISLAGRYNFNEDYENSFTPRVALIYSQNSQMSHKLICSQSFLAPSVHTRYQHYGYSFKQDDGSYIVNAGRIPSPDIEAEKSKILEYNYLYWINQSSFLTISLYRQSIINMIGDQTVYNVIDLLPSLTIQSAKERYNSNEAEMYGGDISLLFRNSFGHIESDSWLNYSYVDGFERVGGEEREIPFLKMHTINLGSTLSYKKFYFTPSMKWVSGVNSGVIDKDDGSKKVKGDGYTLYDLYMKYQLSNGYTISLNIENLTDKRYYGVRKSASPNFQSPQAGRLFIGSIKVEF